MDDFYENLCYVEDYNVRIPKGYLRDPENPLEMFDDAHFFDRKTYRLVKSYVINIFCIFFRYA